MNPITPAFAFSAEEQAEIEQAIHHYEHPRAALIDVLKIVQKYRRWVEDGAIPAIANSLGIAVADVEGVATFYNRIYRRPVGRHVIALCDSVSCFLTGFDLVHASLQQRLGIQSGETTADNRFTLLPVSCLGVCDHGPALMIDNTTHCPVTPGNLQRILEQYP
ncbi:MAG: NADH-quinone oxidoreductase subunit NuoE [Pseudomonadota bacterium]